MIGIIGAESEEVNALISRLTSTKSVRCAAFDYIEARHKALSVVVVQCGVGKVAATCCCQAMLCAYPIDCVIFTGIAGATNSSLSIGDVVISRDTVQHDFDVTAFGRELGEVPSPGVRYVTADKNLVSLALESANKLVELGKIGKVQVGRIMTGDQFIADSEKTKLLASIFSGDAVEMEGAAVAQTCSWNDVPFVIVRTISDGGDSGAKVSFEAFIVKASRISADIVIGMLDRML